MRTKEEILFNNLKIYTYELSTKTLITSNNLVTTYYYVVWHCKNGPQSEIHQEICKDDYDTLYEGLCSKVGAHGFNN